MNVAQNSGTGASETEITFYSLADALKTPEQVVRLDLHYKSLNEIPKEIFSFANLKELVLLNNKITEIPDEIAKLSHLEKN